MPRNTPLLIFYLTLFVLFWQTRLTLFGSQIVDYLIPFLYLTDLLVLSFLIAVAFFERQRFVRFVYQPRLRPVHFFAFLFLFFALFSNTQAIYWVAAWYKWFKLILFYGFALAVGYVFSAKKEVVVKALFFLDAGLVLEAVVAISEVLSQGSLGLQVLGEWRFSVLTPGIAKVFLGGGELLRPYATFPHPNVLGGVMAIVAAVNLFSFLSKRKNWFYLACFFLFSLVSFLSFSRTSWLAYFIMVAVVFFIWVWQKDAGRIRRINLLVAGLGIVLVLFLSPLIWSRFQTLLTTDLLSIERRWQLNWAALTMFWDHSFFGVGLNQFVPNLEQYALISGPDRFLQPVHNVFLLILAEHGLLGALAFTGLLGSVFRTALKSLKPFWLQLVFTVWLGIFIIFFFDHYFWSLQAGQLLFWLVVGASLS